MVGKFSIEKREYACPWAIEALNLFVVPIRLPEINHSLEKAKIN